MKIIVVAVAAAAIFFAGFTTALRLPAHDIAKYQLELATSPQP